MTERYGSKERQRHSIRSLLTNRLPRFISLSTFPIMKPPKDWNRYWVNCDEYFYTIIETHSRQCHCHHHHHQHHQQRRRHPLVTFYMQTQSNKENMTCHPDDVCGHHLLISSMSASRSVQLLETKPSLSPVLDCHQILLRVTLCTVQQEKHSSSDSLIPLFWFSFFSLWFFSLMVLVVLLRPH